MFSVVSMNNKIWTFCTDSVEQLKSWETSLDEARFSMIKSTFPNISNSFTNQQATRFSKINPLMSNPFLPNQFNPMVLPQLNYLQQTISNGSNFNASSPYNPFYNAPIFPQGPAPNMPLLNYSSPNNLLFQNPSLIPPINPSLTYPYNRKQNNQHNNQSNQISYSNNSNTKNQPKNISVPSTNSVSTNNNQSQFTVQASTNSNLPVHNRTPDLGLNVWSQGQFNMSSNQLWTDGNTWWS